MPFHAVHSARRARSVLFLGADAVEWLEVGDAPRRARAATAGQRPDDLAQAALACCRELGIGPTKTTVALSASFAQQRLIALPPLARAELRAVLHRKAAQALGAPPQDTVFAAVPMFDPSVHGDLERRYAISVLRRSFALALLASLRRVGIEVERVVAARMARLSAVERAQGSGEHAVLAIDADAQAVAISLLHKQTLLNQTALDGDLEQTPKLALAVIQEVKSFESFWRRTSRGAALTRACLIGFAPERGELFAHALAAALPDVQVARIPSSGGADAGRIASLEACLERGAFDVDLTIPDAAPTRRRIALAAATAAAVLGLGALARGGVESSLEEIEREAVVLRERGRALEPFELENARIDQRIAELAVELGRLVDLERRGIDLGGAIHDAFAAFEGRATLRGLSLEREDENGGGAKVLLRGETEVDPLRAMRNLAALEDALERSASVREARVLTPATLPRSADGPSRFAFSVEATREASR